MADLKGFGPANRAIYLEHVRNGMQRGAAAEACRSFLARKVREYIATHPAFEAEVEGAEIDATGARSKEALYQAAVNGSGISGQDLA